MVKNCNKFPRILGFFRTECYCSHSYPTMHAKVNDKECNLPCSGNSKESCGGKLRIAVYDNGIPRKYRSLIKSFEKIKSSGIWSSFLADPQAFVDKFYMGCYKDDVLGVKLLEGTSSDMGEYLSPTVCYKQCLLTGFLYFGLIRSSDERWEKMSNQTVCTENSIIKFFDYNLWWCFSEKCLCSDNDPPESLLTHENECQKKCSGDSNKVCGNDWRVATYRTGLSGVYSFTFQRFPFFERISFDEIIFQI